VVTGTIETLAFLAAAAGLFLHIVPAAEAGMPLRSDTAEGFLVWGDIPARETARLATPGRAAVVLDPCHPTYAGYTGPAVRLDNAGGAAAVTRHLIDRGAHRLLCVVGIGHHLGHREREQTARRTWRAARPAATYTAVPYDRLTDRRLADFARRPGGAIFCSNDGFALQVLHRLNRLGLRVPADVQLAGFDGIPAARWLALTTAAVDTPALARAAFTLLEDQLFGRPLPAFIPPVPVTLVSGATT
jgi:LacI family transcriptional regulator